MKACFICLALTVAAASVAHASDATPINQVFAMLGDLQGKIIKEGEAAQKTYDEFSEWCDDRSKNAGFEIKTGKAEVADLSAAIEKATAIISSSGTKIEELAASVAGDDSDLKAATAIRTSEAADFAAEEKESKDVISTLERAIAVLSREAAKGGASMLQSSGTQSVAQALAAMVQASLLSAADSTRLTSLVQSSNSDGEESFGAPAAAVYEGKSGGIIGTLEDLLDKAQMLLESARKTEGTNAQNFALLKQSLEDEIAAAEKDMAEVKKSAAASEESKSAAQGDLSVTSADLKEDIGTLANLHQDCMVGAQDFQAATKSRGEELSALAGAKKVLAESLPALVQETSFLQVSALASGADLAKYEAVRFIRDLARKDKSTALAQLASKMTSVIRFGASSGSDPFSKVKSLISDMIATLEKAALADASQKAFCDKETAETTAKKQEKAHEISKLSTKVSSMSAKSAKLKEEVATVQKELADVAASQTEINKIRSDEKAVFDKNQPELAAGIAGVQKALTVLRDYYAQGAGKSDAGGGIISMLEVVESDFTRGLTEMEVSESSAVAEYEKISTMNKFTKVSKDKDLEYKSKEATGLDKSVAETSSDKEGLQAELDALLEYLAKLGEMCVAKAEPFAEKKARREAEVAGLKEALTILEGEAALLQRNHAKRSLRGKH